MFKMAGINMSFPVIIKVEAVMGWLADIWRMIELICFSLSTNIVLVVTSHCLILPIWHTVSSTKVEQKVFVGVVHQIHVVCVILVL